MAKLNILDAILIDLFEKDAFVFFRKPSDDLTGKLSDELMEEICQLLNTPEDRIKAQEIFKKQNKQVISYFNGINSLLRDGFVEKDSTVKADLYNLRLTTAGRVRAANLIDKRREEGHKLNIEKISRNNMYMTIIIAVSTVFNVAIAIGNYFSKTDQPNIEVNPIIQIDKVIAVPDSTVLEIEIPQIEKEGS